ncbi:LOW QUALITY PROTEIN: RNB domain-containing protein, partial [Cephalotus follicularis]
MAVRAINSSSIFRSASCYPLPPPLSVLRCRIYPFRTFYFRRYSKLGFRFSEFGSELHISGYGCNRSCSVHSLVESVMEALEATRLRKRVCVTAKLSNDELVEDKLVNRVVEKGLLLEFKKDSDRALLAVAQRPDGKKNWMVFDQNGVSSSIKPQQITYIIPGVENFDHMEIPNFLQRAQNNLMIFGSMEPLESYCAHLLLSKDEIYFTVQERKGSRFIYGPRPSVQVEELLRRKLAKEVEEKELQGFVHLLMSAKAMPDHAKPPKSSWLLEEKIQHKIESLEAYAIDACKTDEQKRTAGTILKEMGLSKTASSAVNLLIGIGYFPAHVNLDVFKLNIRTDHSDEIMSLLLESSDQDEMNRTNLTLEVYAIDVDEADELDDALSATRLQDGRIKVWIHVADPAAYVQPGSIVDRKAMSRATSVFLPTATYPIFPENLAMDGMSLKQGKFCNAVTVSVVLHSNGSIAEYSVHNSIIKPTYMLTYESASELLHLNLEEEVELKILSEAAALRFQWRCQQGAVDTVTLETRIKVVKPEDPQPTINIYVENQADPAMRLVSEMMILCGEVVATYGSRNNIPLPYRGQPQSNIDVSAFAHLPEGPVRSSAIVKIMRAAEFDFRNPVRHGILGVPGYVQFTSPIRRYMDLLSHYQVKAFLRGESLPFSAGQLEGMASIINMQVRVVRRLCNSSLRYWILEFLRRQPKERKYRALILRFIQDRIAGLLLIEVGFQASAWVSLGKQVGDEVEVQVEEAQPRDDVLSLKEVLK